MPNENGNKEVLEAISKIGAQVTSLGEGLKETNEAIQTLATHMDERFDEVTGELREEMHGLEMRLSDKIDHVDKKVDVVNNKVDLVAEKLMVKKVISHTDAAEIMHFDPKFKQS
jgi:uncharacterized phage infection (PIP) family protein YhgE